MARLLVATESEVLVVDAESGEMTRTAGLDGTRPTCLATDRRGGAWYGSDRGGVFRSEDGGASWLPSGLADQRITALAASPAEGGLVWAGTEPSSIWRSADGGRRWQSAQALEVLPSSPEWSFPPRPETHHVRWIACHPHRPDHLWVAIEAGALISTDDGGQSWHDRVPGGPWDTHELAVHPESPEALRIAAGDGYFESEDGGSSWSSPEQGLDVRYLRSVAIDPGQPDIVLVSAASRPRTTYQAGRSDGRLYRREGGGVWEWIRAGWPDPPTTIAPLLRAGDIPGELWAADERGVHRSEDGGSTWRQIAAFPVPVLSLRGLALLERSAASEFTGRGPPRTPSGSG